MPSSRRVLASTFFGNNGGKNTQRDRERILIIGGSGLLGKRILDLLRGKSVFATYCKRPLEDEDAFALDITDKRHVEKAFKKVRPSLVIHTAAFTNVDGCEKERDKAYNVNVEGTRNVAVEAKKYGAKLVYISTDYVFDGRKGLYKEDDETNPINYYGLTKLQGEEVVMELCDEYIIARTSVIYGRGRGNFATWVVDELKKGNELRIITDQFVSPTLNTDLAYQILSLARADVRGVFHTAGADRISRFDFALKIAEEFGFDPRLIVPAQSDILDWVAKRPKDSSLDVSKVSRIRKPLKIHTAIQTMRGEML